MPLTNAVSIIGYLAQDLSRARRRRLSPAGEIPRRRYFTRNAQALRRPVTCNARILAARRNCECVFSTAGLDAGDTGHRHPNKWPTYGALEVRIVAESSPNW